MPSRYRHSRLSEGKVRDDVYRALAKPSGEGLSPLESVKAVADVANSCFGRAWKIPGEDAASLDTDNAPWEEQGDAEDVGGPVPGPAGGQDGSREGECEDSYPVHGLHVY